MEEVVKCIGQYCYDPSSKPIGSGIFCSVYKGHRIENPSEEVAVKVIPAQILQQYKENLKLFIREIEILKNIKGKHVLELKDAMQSDSGNIYLVTNYCNGGSLETEICKQKRLPIKIALKYLRQVAEAFEDISKLDLKDSAGKKIVLIHRDIKPGNILIHNGDAVLADFGFSKFVTDSEKSKKENHTKLGTPFYMAPQIITLQEYSFKCDIWSMGVVTYELIFGKRPWVGASNSALLQNIKQIPLSFEESSDNELKDLLSKMLQYEERKRLDWKQVLEHPVFKVIDEPDKLSYEGLVDNVKMKPDSRAQAFENLHLSGDTLVKSQWKEDKTQESLKNSVQTQNTIEISKKNEEDMPTEDDVAEKPSKFQAMPQTKPMNTLSMTGGKSKIDSTSEKKLLMNTEIEQKKQNERAVIWTSKTGKVRILEDS